MTRIKQFANDMGLSYNQAKGLVEKGRKKKDGGSTVLESFMPGTAKVIKKQRGGKFDLSKISEENLTDEERKKESRRLKNEILRLSKPGTTLKDMGEDLRFGNVTSGRPKKRRQPQGSGKYMTQAEKDMAKAKAKGDVKEQKRLQAIERSKAANKRAAMGIGSKAQSIKGGPGPQGKKLKRMKDGGSNKVLKPIPPDNKGLQALKKERPDVVASMGFKKKGGMLSFDMGGMNDMEDGTYMAKIESLQIVPTEKKTMGSPGPRARPKGGPAKRPKMSRNRKRGPATGGEIPRSTRGQRELSRVRKRFSGGGVARGTGAAVKGTGFKGVY